MGYLVSASGKVLGPNFKPNLLLADCCWVRGGIGARNWLRGSETILLQPTPPFYTTLAVRFFYSLNIVILHFSTSAELVGYVTLRLLKPMCRIDQAWCEEDLLSATKRVISVLHSTSVPDLNTVGSSSSDSLTELLSAPAFAFCFPFLRCVLRDGGKNVKGNEDLRQQALQIVAEHCKLRANNDDDDEEDEQDEVSGMLPHLPFLPSLVFILFWFTHLYIYFVRMTRLCYQEKKCCIY